jgi:hypothetical protein
MNNKSEDQKARGQKSRVIVGGALPVAVLAALLLWVTAPMWFGAPAAGGTPANVIYRSGVVVDTPTITIAGATATTTSTPTTAAREAHVLWQFGTVSGTYTTCTAQAKTTYDGVNFVNLGGTAALTVTSTTVNAWDIYQQAAASTGATVTAPSPTSGTGFGQATQFVFACTAYGTSAPVTVTVIYR